MPSPLRRGSRQSETGSVIFIILIAIILLAALSYAMSQGTRTGEQTISAEKARLAGDEIMDWAQTVKTTVQSLRINGCGDTEISFENSTVAGYNNPSAPTDESCHLFESAGGGLRWVSPTSGFASGQWEFNGGYLVEDIGSTNSELLMSVSGVNATVCEQINEKLGINNPSGPPTNDSYAVTQFQGVYDDGGATAIGDDGEESNFAGKQAACFDGPPSGTYHFYQVLIVR